MKKLLLAMIITTGLLTTLGLTASAEGTLNSTAQSTVTESTYSKPTINKDDPLYLSLKDKYSQLEVLRDSEDVIHNSFESQNITNKALTSTIAASIKRLAGKDNQASQEAISVLQNEISTLRTQKASLYNQLSVAISTYNKETNAAINIQIKAVNSQISAKEHQITAIRSKSKENSKEFIALKEKAKATNVQIRSIDASTMAMHAEILNFKASKELAWVGFYNSLRAADLVAANTHMSNILSYKSQIIAKETSILNNKSTIETLLKEVAALIR